MWKALSRKIVLFHMLACFPLQASAEHELSLFLKNIALSLNGEGYVLTGAKPMAILDITTKSHPFAFLGSVDNPLYHIPINPTRLQKEWDSRAMDHLILCPTFSDDFTQFYLLINRNSLEEVFETHQGLFKKKLGNACTAQTLLKALLNSREILPLGGLNGDEELLGILLGYGAENGKWFRENHLGRPTLPKKEIESLEKHLHLYSQAYGLISVPLPSFKIFDEKEGIERIKHYQRNGKALKKLAYSPTLEDLFSLTKREGLDK